MVIFPDIEKILVNYFKAALLANGSAIAQNVRVATKKAPPLEVPQPEKEVVLIANLGREDNYVMRNASVVIEVYADTYAKANELGLLVEALVRGCVGEEIKLVEVRVGPTRVSESTTYEKRSLDVGLVVKGTNV